MTFVPIMLDPDGTSVRRRRRWRTRAKIAMAGLIAVGLIAAITSAWIQLRKPPQPFEPARSGTPLAAVDPAIAGAVRAALKREPSLTGLTISVTSENGVVTLEGLTPNEAAKSKAAGVAQGIPGVHAVQNRLLSSSI